MQANELKSLRKYLKLNQKQRAEQLGVSAKTYWLYENGKLNISKPVQKLLDIEQNSIAIASLSDTTRA